MYERTFAITEFEVKTNGGVWTLRAGDVWSMNSWGAFADVLILGFSADGETKVARPYAYASSTGTTGPVALLGMEVYTLPVTHIVENFTKKGDGRLT